MVERARGALREAGAREARHVVGERNVEVQVGRRAEIQQVGALCARDTQQTRAVVQRGEETELRIY